MNENIVLSPYELLDLVSDSRKRGFIAGVAFSIGTHYCVKAYKRVKAENRRLHSVA